MTILKISHLKFVFSVAVKIGVKDACATRQWAYHINMDVFKLGRQWGEGLVGTAVVHLCSILKADSNGGNFLAHDGTGEEMIVM